MNVLPSLPVAVPMAVAALVMGSAPVLPRRLADLFAISAAVATTVVCAMLLSVSSDARIVYWFGGWQPENGIALGISFTIDQFGAGLATLVGALSTAAFTFAWRYFQSVGTLFHTLMLIFMAGMIGFCLSGDIFTMFVFFELMSVSAYGLTGYKIEKSPLLGSLNFAVTNSVGAFLILTGIGLLYGRTGALNLAQLGRSMSTGQVDGLVVAAFVFILTGFFVKAAVVPFHFWLADAHAVAPTPVSVLFSGAMVGLGLYGAARVYWTVFSGPLDPYTSSVRAVLIGAGTLTAILGGTMCLIQRHIKRLLAFSTISHMGVILIGIATLHPVGLAGGATYLVAHGMTKGALFLCAGILLQTCSSVDEIELYGRARHMVFTGSVFILGGLALAGLPPCGMYIGESLIEETAAGLGYPWIRVVLVAVSILTGGAVLRVAGRVFLGLGEVTGEESTAPSEHEKQEMGGQHGTTPWETIVPAVILVVAAFLTGLIPDVGRYNEVASARFQDRPGYAAAVLDGDVNYKQMQYPRESPTKTGTALSFTSAFGAVALAAAALFRNRLPKLDHRMVHRVFSWATRQLEAMHIGHVGDYIAWLVLGVALFGILFGATLR